MPEVEQMMRGMSLEPANWIPLERLIGRQSAEFMWMYRKDGVEFYKHVETRRYLLLDSESRCYRQADTGGLVEADFEQELRLASGIESRPVLERQLAEESDRKTEEMAAMNGTEQTIAIRTWICEASAQRVGQTWREEDHAALVRNMRAADTLTVQLVDFVSERAVQTALQTVRREDFQWKPIRS